ncbi:hypothetical protein [Falsirhodobacter halotolerans]|uniref:hypothetical protein n=1 Tax=Falsirhodobacter halotolerans TaxID=1146892 RepID=UPI001FD04391|nr:hypothetical protein [Falsirhodobacter halotolerans]MCJ8139071.1 hypothetical protein [Falsirhodobacter halotolerans]
MRVIFLAPLLLVAGCSQLQQISNPSPATAPPAAQPSAPPPAIGAGAARSVDSYDLTSAAERERALATPASAGAERLASVVVTLGNAAEPGFWLRSSLVKQPAKGRVETSDGQSVAVDLLPGAGSAQLSLAAYRALGLSLTALPQVDVYRN